MEDNDQTEHRRPNANSRAVTTRKNKLEVTRSNPGPPLIADPPKRLGGCGWRGLASRCFSDFRRFPAISGGSQLFPGIPRNFQRCPAISSHIQWFPAPSQQGTQHFLALSRRFQDMLFFAGKRWVLLGVQLEMCWKSLEMSGICWALLGFAGFIFGPANRRFLWRFQFFNFGFWTKSI